MEIDHVAFAGMRKFDGEKSRHLLPAEIGQIAGRAGRYQKDGTFGVTHEARPLDEKLVAAIESHQYDTIDRLCWRNRRLAFGSTQALIDSLAAPPPSPLLYRARDGEDYTALKSLCADRDVAMRATNPAAIRLLWEVCQVPDFRKVMPDIHVRLLRRIYLHLASSETRLPADWIGGHIAPLDNVSGDIDTLTQRIAHIRTWTYISHRADWLDDTAHWQGLARAIEDRLSDALHARLLQRFVDRRASVMAKRRDGELLSFVNKDGEVVVEGVVVGRLSGLTFRRDESQSRAESRVLVAAARTTIDGDVARRVAELRDADDGAFSLSRAGWIRWRGLDLAILRPGDSPLRPVIALPRNEFLGKHLEAAVLKRLERWLDGHVRRRLRALFSAGDADLGAAGRGIVFQLAARLGSVPRAEARAQIAALDARDRKTLSRLGLRFGAHMVYLNPLLRPAARRLRAILAAVHAGVPAPRLGRAATPAVEGLSAEIWAQIGYRVLGGRAFRFDCAERLAAGIRKRARKGAFAIDADLIALAGCEGAALAGILDDLGYQGAEAKGTTIFTVKKRRRRRARRDVSRSPFAVLRDLAI
jgi:ATP-dependent RNA helicase SUPV3L1/SUV3